jgi:ubiquinone biosynthesis protein COQ9
VNRSDRTPKSNEILTYIERHQTAKRVEESRNGKVDQAIKRTPSIENFVVKRLAAARPTEDKPRAVKALTSDNREQWLEEESQSRSASSDY